MSMFRRPWVAGRLLATSMIVAGLAGTALAQRGADEPESGPEHAVIERMPLDLRDASTYQVPLHLDPVTSIELVARLDGVISNVFVTPGEKLSAQSETARMDSAERRLGLDRAKAAFQLAQLENNLATEGQASAIAAARLDVASADLQLAEHRLDDTIIRTPFDGTITEVHVVAGQFVRAGDPLVTLADLTRFTVDIPVGRREVSEGDTLEFRVEDQTVTGDVAQILPLSERFEPLRDLFLSIATARVNVSDGGLAAGQTVYSDMIPRHPVAEIPTAALLNTDDGQKKVQVIREEFVRDVVVVLLGQNGEEHVFVTGRFGPVDELVVKSSEELLDGTRVVPSTAAEAASGAGGRRPGPARRDDF